MYPRTVMVGAASYDPAASALFARMSPAPSYTRKLQMNRLIRDLKRYGIWTKLDILYVFAQSGAANSLLNWKSSSYNGANNAATFTTDRGYTGDGSTAYIQASTYAAGTGQYAQNDHHMGAWMRSAGASGKGIMGGGEVVGYSNTITHGGSSLIFCDAQTIAPDTFTATNTGHIVQSRTASGTFDAYRAGTLLGAPSRSVTNPTSSFLILAINLDAAAANFSAGEVSAAHFGAGLTATQVANFGTALQTYMTAVGA